ncbi:MAG: acetate kinase [Cyanobacteria bacterium P01_F01_bin.42]
MHILVLNGGSSSHKLSLYRIDDDSSPSDLEPLWKHHIDWSPPFSPEVLTETITSLWSGDSPVLKQAGDIDAVGHRVVHGGEHYRSSVLVTPEVKAAIADLIPLAPIHNPINLKGIELTEALLGHAVQVAVFDTAFHHQMPEAAALYPGPYSWKQAGIRRYGFHGISHQYCTERAVQLLQSDPADLKLIICHLGNGASLSAVNAGRSINTTMGFTPLDGLMMGTRSGSVDPSILIHLMRQGYSADRLDHMLNQESGLMGVSGVSHDLREIEAAIADGNERAKLALEMYIHRLQSCLGEMLMSLGGLDGLIFTAGVGEHSAMIRARVCDSLAFLGVALDPSLNENVSADQDIATNDSTVRVLVIQTQEDLAIAQQVYHLGRSIV